jgi:O-antigen/teichoic acid export membrane protein
LRQQVIKGSAFEMISFGASQIVRFGSNLVLSRLLFPQAFGIVAIVNIVNQGLIMFSDVGSQAAVIQSEQGEEPRFLNTVFTWQALRGVLLYCVALALSWPLAAFYKEPQLKLLIPVGSLSVLVLGLHSTATYTLRRRLTLAPLVTMELSAQVAAVVLMVTWARLHPSVWTLVAGTLVSALVTTGISHLLRVGYRNRFSWDRASARALFDFGKWIAGSSMLSFLGQQGDRLLLGRFLGTAALGVYSIAVFLSSALGDAVQRVTQGVLFPAYSRVRPEGIARVREVYYQTRLAIDGLVVTALGGLTALGGFVVHLLYDTRYADAGWMLQVLSLRVALNAIAAPCQFCLFALGETRQGFMLNLARIVWLATAVPVGFNLAGVHGLVWAVALSELPTLFVLWPAFARLGLLRPSRELLAPACYGTGYALGLGVLWLLSLVGLH